MEKDIREVPDNDKAPNKRQQVDPPHSKAKKVIGLAVDDDFLQEIVSFAKKNQERALTSSECLGILLLQAYLWNDKWKKKKKKACGRTTKAP